MYIQTPNVEVKCYRLDGTELINYLSFSPDSNNCLLSYNFSKNVHNFSGDFSFSIKDNNNYFEKIKTLDLIKIIENEKTVFFGEIETITISKTANQGATIIIAGKEICHLFEKFFISYDLSSLIFLNNNEKASIQNIEFKLAVNNGKDAISIEDGLKTLYEDFSNTAANPEKYGMGYIKQLIDACFKNGIFNCDKNLKFDYPISSNLFQEGSEVSFIEYVRNLLHSSVYELYGYIDNGNPKINVRQVPFDSDSWMQLEKKATEIDTEYLISYSLRKSCEEVYTTFISYLDNSPESSETNQRAVSLENSPHAVINEEKFKRYGYKPLKVSFVGFNNGGTTPSTRQEFEESVKKQQNDFTSKLSDLNNNLNNWYSKLDEMLTGSITLANNYGDEIQIGEVIHFNNNYFYVTSITHNWKYGSNGTVSYSVDRGGTYVKGVFYKEGNVYK